jgi:hydroxymethylpyrimidine/phosphomethylpyrimidine kinase
MHSQFTAALAIAGFDPSAGAGVLADVKTFERIGVYACGAATAITWQNESSFKGLEWLSADNILKQLDTLAETIHFSVAKIGLVKDADTLSLILDWLKKHNPEIQIVWDPVLRATAGFDFHEDFSLFNKLFEKFTLLTPNLSEACKLAGKENPVEAARKIAQKCAVYLKDGHGENSMARDVLLTGTEEFHFEQERLPTEGKHGSGCVLSSAIAAYLFKGYELKEACRKAHEYTRGYLQSSDHLLGYHFKIAEEIGYGA